MTKLILSTGNVMSAGPTVIRKTNGSRSNLELVNSLRENFLAAQHDYATPSTTPPTNGHDSTPALLPTPVEQWTSEEEGALFVPRIDWRYAGLRDETSQYEITVKLFFLPNTPVSEHDRYVQEALALVRKELGIDTVDLLVVSFPGMSFEGTCEWEADKLNAQQGNLDEQVASWRVVEKLQQSGVVARLGVAEFGSDKLRAFMDRTTIHPSVDQVNLKDCCSVPPPLKQLAAEAGIELNVHSDATDILPPGTLREILNGGPHGAGVIANAAQQGPGLKGDVLPQWVVRYTAFVRDRGVVENKGYFAGAEISN